MREKKNIIEKIASGKGFYITAALSFVMIVAAIAFVYNSSVNMLRDLDIPTTAEQVEKNQTNVSDPRVEHTTDKADDMYSAEENTEATEPRQSTATQTTAQTTTEPVTKATQVFKNDSFMLPVNTDIYRAFSMSPVYDETMEDWRIHKGVDFSAQAGTDVLSIGNGKVVKVVSDTAYGYYIDIDYGDFIARYCGLEENISVQEGDTVSLGSKLGTLGAIPSECSDKSHLHLEFFKDEIPIDPISLIKG